MIPWKEFEPKPYFGGRLKRVKWLVGNVPRLIGTGREEEGARVIELRR